MVEVEFALTLDELRERPPGLGSSRSGMVVSRPASKSPQEFTGENVLLASDSALGTGAGKYPGHRLCETENFNVHYSESVAVELEQ